MVPVRRAGGVPLSQDAVPVGAAGLTSARAHRGEDSRGSIRRTSVRVFRHSGRSASANKKGGYLNPCSGEDYSNSDLIKLISSYEVDPGGYKYASHP
jgi:hypothetical protein